MKRKALAKKAAQIRRWPHVITPIDEDKTEAAQWCEDYKSSGQYCIRKRGVMPPGKEWSWERVWYFERQEDAVLFALKFV